MPLSNPDCVGHLATLDGKALGGRRRRGMPQLKRGGRGSKGLRSEDTVSREETEQTNKKRESLNIDSSFLGNHDDFHGVKKKKKKNIEGKGTLPLNKDIYLK